MSGRPEPRAQRLGPPQLVAQLRRASPSADPIVRTVHVEVEPGDDARIVAGRKLRDLRGDPGVALLRIGDDVRITPCAHGQDPGRLAVRIAEGMQAGTSLGTEE